MGREPLEILRLAAGLWYTERRDLITALHLLLRVFFFCLRNHSSSFGHYLIIYLVVNTSVLFSWQAVVLDQGLQDDILVDIQKYLEDLISSGLRQRLISLIKV